MKKTCPSIMKVYKMKKIKRPVGMTLKGISRNRMMEDNIVTVAAIGPLIIMMSQMR